MSPAGDFPVPALPPDVERTNPTLAAEFETVTKNLRTLTSQIALLDRIHSIKVGSQPPEMQLWCLLLANGTMALSA